MAYILLFIKYLCLHSKGLISYVYMIYKSPWINDFSNPTREGRLSIHCYTLHVPKESPMLGAPRTLSQRFRDQSLQGSNYSVKFHWMTASTLWAQRLICLGGVLLRIVYTVLWIWSPLCIINLFQKFSLSEVHGELEIIHPPSSA